MAVTMKNGVFWDATPRGFCKNRLFGGTYHLHHQGEKSRRVRKNVVLPNRLFLQDSHSVTSQKMAFFKEVKHFLKLWLPVPKV
jgi:hypothetical protein